MADQPEVPISAKAPSPIGDPLIAIATRLGEISADVRGLKLENQLAVGSRKEIHQKLEGIAVTLATVQHQMDTIEDHGRRIQTLEQTQIAASTTLAAVPRHADRIDQLESKADKREGRAAVRGAVIGVGVSGGVGGFLYWLKSHFGW